MFYIKILQNINRFNSSSVSYKKLQFKETVNRLLNPNNNDHIILLYDNDQSRDDAVTQYLNEGLKRNQLCVYASIHMREKEHLKHIADKIENYEENIATGNLLVIDLAPFYIAALCDNLTPFENARQMFVDKVKDRADKHIRFVGDGTGFLFKNKHFEACLALEGWWQQKPFVGSCVCPFSKSIFEAYPYSNYQRSLLTAKHDVAIDTEGRVVSTFNVTNDKNGGNN
jgi:hypothetical protein